MSFTLGSTTLPRPNSFKQQINKVGSKVQAMTGKNYEEIRTIKNIYKLNFEYIEQSDLDAILNEFNNLTALNFSASDGDISVSIVSVLVDIEGGKVDRVEGYLTNITLVLTEV